VSRRGWGDYSLLHHFDPACSATFLEE